MDDRGRGLHHGGEANSVGAAFIAGSVYMGDLLLLFLSFTLSIVMSQGVIQPRLVSRCRFILCEIIADTLVWTDERFQKDREDYSGRSWRMEDVERGRPEALVGMRGCWDLLEGFLGDGREWIGGTKEVGLADVNGT